MTLRRLYFDHERPLVLGLSSILRDYADHSYGPGISPNLVRIARNWPDVLVRDGLLLRAG